MFSLRQFYLGYPVAVAEAALIDGASRWQIYLNIFLPQSKAPFLVVGIASLLAYWKFLRLAGAGDLQPEPDPDHAVPGQFPVRP
jgi:multiple sugar transport system permease protein